jgi:hypothetical protein
MPVENMTLSEFFGSNRNPYNYAKVEQIARDTVTQWLSLEEITQQLNLFQDESQDAYLESIELATRFAIEDYLGMAIFSTQFRVYYGNSGVYGSALYLDLPEVSIGSAGVTLNSVVYYGVESNAPITLAAGNYFYDQTGNRVVVSAIPTTLNQTIDNPIIVTYTQNSNPMAFYPVVKQAGLMLLTHLYNNRSASSNGAMNTTQMISWGVDTLLRPYKPLVM